MLILITDEHQHRQQTHSIVNQLLYKYTCISKTTAII